MVSYRCDITAWCVWKGRKLVRLSLYIDRDKELYTKNLSKQELIVQLMVVFWGIRDPDNCPMDDIFDVEVWWLRRNIEGTRRRLRGAPAQVVASCDSVMGNDTSNFRLNADIFMAEERKLVLVEMLVSSRSLTRRTV